MATLVNFTCKSFIKLIPGSIFAAISGPVQFLVYSGETRTHFPNRGWKSSLVIANVSAEANLLTCGDLTHFQGRHFTLQQSGNACLL